MNLKEKKLFIYDQVLSIGDISIRHFLFYHVRENGNIFSNFNVYGNHQWKLEEITNLGLKLIKYRKD